MSNPTDSSSLRVHDVSFSYRTAGGESAVLKHVSFSLAPRDFAALYGPSGSGKTTLINIVATLENPQSGTVHIGEDLASGDDEKAKEIIRRNNVGIVFQEFSLMPALTALENVELAIVMAEKSRRRRRDCALTALEQVGLGHRAHFFPAQLSGGQKQRVGVARALVKAPLLVVADEPTANLDSATAMELIELLKKIAAGGVAFLVATHDQRILDAAHRHLHLSDGQLSEAFGTRGIHDLV
jgi:putative ABC transport system ATP-binding protein